MINLNGLLTAFGIGILIGAISGYFIGKRFGGGWGSLSGIGITILVTFLIGTCKPCMKKLNEIYYPVAHIKNNEQPR